METRTLDVHEAEPLGMNYSAAAAELVTRVKRIVQVRNDEIA